MINSPILSILNANAVKNKIADSSHIITVQYCGYLSREKELVFFISPLANSL